MAINRDKILQEAQKLVEKKRFDKAIVEYQKIVAEDPTDVRTLLKIGDLHLKLEQHADAIGLYERVGQFYSAQGFSVKAVAVYKQIREIIQKHVPHLEDRFGHIVPKLAELLTQLGLTSDALMYYDEMATRFQRLGRERDAIDVFRKIVSLDPQNPLSHLRLADAFVRVRDLDGAVEEYALAGEILLRIGRQDDAIRVVERILMHRQDAKYARLAAEIYLSRAQPNDGMAALTKLQLCFKEDPRDLDTLALLARAFEQLGQPSKAIEVQKEAARIARETGKMDVFQGLLQVLLARAPNDEGVRQLAQASLAAPPQSLAPQSLAPQGLAPQPQQAAAPGQARAAAQTGLPQTGLPRTAPPPAAGPVSAAPVSEAMEVVDDDLEVIDDDLEAVSDVDVAPEELGSDEEPPFALRSSAPPPDQSPAQRVRQILAQVESLRRQGDYHHAVLTLQTGVSGMPSARELREKLCDLLIESGDQEQAIVEMLGFASYLGQAGDGDGAARLLDEVLLLDPSNEAALTMLAQLGYAVPEAPEASADIAYAEPAYSGEHYAAGRASESGYEYGQLGYPDPSEPLPSYDLEGNEEVTAPPSMHIPSVGKPRTPSGGIPVVELDDPFQGEAPYGLPADPYAEGASLRHAAPPVPPVRPEPPRPPVPPQAPQMLPPELARPARPEPLPSFPIDEPTHYGLAVDPSALHPGDVRQSEGGQLDESALEEMEFFQSHGMFDEAEGLLREQLSRLPNHPILLEKQRELQALRAERTSGIVAPAEPTVDRSFDIASALGGLDALDSVAPPPPPAAGPQQVSVETVFEQFKAGVAAQVADNDAATHYDLGVAYKEMGLLADAINEFELASRDPARECVAQSMIGMMNMEQGNVDQAIDAFIRGLHASQKSTEQELALTYEIGNAYEYRQNREQALYYFQLVARIDPNYRDPRGSVEERISNLEEPHEAPPRAAAAGGADEFDAAFDDLFDGPKR